MCHSRGVDEQFEDSINLLDENISKGWGREGGGEERHGAVASV